MGKLVEFPMNAVQIRSGRNLVRLQLDKPFSDVN